MNKQVNVAEIKASAKLKSPLDPKVTGLCEEIAAIQKNIDASGARGKAESKARSALVMEQFLAGCQAFAMVGYGAERSYAVRAFKADLKERKIKDKAVKEIAELGRHVIGKAKKWHDFLTKDGQKVDALVAFQTWPRDALRDMLKAKGLETVTQIRRDKYGVVEWPDAVMKAVNSRKGKKNAEILELYSRLNAFMAENPTLEADDDDTEE